MAFYFATSGYNHTIYCWHVEKDALFDIKICKIFQSINFAKQPVNLNEIRWDSIWILCKLNIKKSTKFPSKCVSQFFRSHQTQNDDKFIRMIDFYTQKSNSNQQSAMWAGLQSCNMQNNKTVISILFMCVPIYLALIPMRCSYFPFTKCVLYERASMCVFEFFSIQMFTMEMLINAW